jgi:hypothetical protein
MQSRRRRLAAVCCFLELHSTLRVVAAGVSPAGFRSFAARDGGSYNERRRTRILLKTEALKRFVDVTEMRLQRTKLINVGIA